MKKITIISHHTGLQGSYLNILDFNHYLQTKENYKVLFYTCDIKDLFEVTRGSKRVHRFDEVKLLKDYEPNEEDIVVTDFKTLIKMFKLEIRIVCKKLIVMDNNELSYHLNDVRNAKFYHKNLNINNLIENHKYKDILFLFPPSNVEQFTKQYPNLPFKVFFKKINWDLLKDIPIHNIDRLYYRFDDIDNLKEIEHKYGDKLITFNEYDELDLWDYKGMIYRRRKHLSYYEQLGRLIFEFIMLGKEVHFLKNPFEVADGLSDYLRHYDIQFDENYKVITPAENLIYLMERDYKFKPWSI
jgi:hypothetical protein